MIGTISIECNAKNPNMPLHPLRAYINSPSSLRITNVPRKIGKWNINKVTIVAIYPDSTSQTAECVLTGGVWVGTIEGSTTAGTLTQGYTIIADGVDENGNDVTGYVLGKGDVEIMKADGVPEPEPATIFVKLQDDGTGAEDGDMYPTESGYMIQQNGEAHQLGTPFEQITSYVDSAISSKADLSTLDDYTKIEDLSSKADLSAIPTNTSQLSNDSGFITSADIITKRDISDMRVKGVPQNTNTQSWFTIKYGTTTENAWYYSEGRWESGMTTKVLATSTPQVFDLQRYIESQWTSLGTFSLDNKSEATDTYDGVTYSITGYVGDIVTSSELPTKTSDLTNDSGFITSADIPTPSYIEDAIGNKINANLSCTYIDDTAWEVTDPSNNTYTLELVGHTIFRYGVWEYVLPETINMKLGYSGNEWGLSVYSWVQDPNLGTYSWVLSVLGYSAADQFTNYIPDFYNQSSTINYSAQRPVVKSDKLATHGQLSYSNKKNINQSAAAVQLEDRTVQSYSLTAATTTLVLPSLTSGKTADFVLDVTNAYTSGDTPTSATFTLSGTIGTTFNILVPEGENFVDMTTLEASEMAEFYFTKTAFQLSSLPTWKVVKQKVEPYTPTTI